MASRVKVYEDPNTGEMVAYMPTSETPIPITPDQLEILRESGPEAFLQAADNAIRQAGTGARALISGAFSEPGNQAEATNAQAMAELGQLRTEGALRGGASPWAGGLGGLAPDVAVGALTGGIGSAAGRIAGTAAIEGTLGATRNPEDPLRAGITQGLVGGALMGAPVAGTYAQRALHPFTQRVTGAVSEVIGRVRPAADDLPGVYRSGSGATGFADEAAEATGRAPEAVPAARVVGAADEPIPASVDEISGSGVDLARQEAQDLAAGRALQPAGADISRGLTPEQLTSGQMRHSSAITADDMVDEFGFPLSEQDAGMISATDDATFERARAAKLEDWEKSRSGGGVLTRLMSGRPTDYGELSVQQERAIRRNLSAEIGQPQAQRLTRDMVGENLTRISDELDGLIAQSGPVRVGPIKKGWQALIDRRPNGPAAGEMRNMLSELEDIKGATGTAREIAQLRNQLTKSLEWAAKNEPEPRYVETMAAARDMLDDELKRRWTPDMQEQFETLGRQWKLSQALVRGAKGALTYDGALNFDTFMNNWRQLDQMVKTGRRPDDRFLKFMETAGMIRNTRGRDSGTPIGMREVIKDTLKDAAIGAIPGAGMLR